MFNYLGEGVEVGTGYLIVPSGQSVDQYRRFCANTGTISILTEMHGTFNSVKIGKDHMQLLNFPKDVSKLGTMVLWIREPFQHNTFVISVLSKDIDSSFDSGQTIGNVDKQNVSSTSYSATNGTSVTTIQHETKAVHQVSVKSPNKSALHVTEVSGSLEQQAEYILNEAEKNISLITINPETNEASSIGIEPNKVAIHSEEILLGLGTEPMVLGGMLYQFFQKKIDILEKTTVHTILGQMPLITKEEIDKLRDDLDDLMSQTCSLS